MNKSELVAAIAEKAEMSKKDAEKALKAQKDAGEGVEMSEENKKAVENWQKFVANYNRPMKEGLYSDFANSSAMVDLPIRRAPSISRAFWPFVFSFQFNSLL